MNRMKNMKVREAHSKALEVKKRVVNKMLPTQKEVSLAQKEEVLSINLRVARSICA